MRNKNVCLTQLWGVSIITPDLLTLCLVFEITFHMSKLEIIEIYTLQKFYNNMAIKVLYSKTHKILIS